MNAPTCTQVAQSFDLWGEYVDPDATMARETFDAMTVEEKVELIHETFHGCPSEDCPATCQGCGEKFDPRAPGAMEMGGDICPDCAAQYRAEAEAEMALEELGPF